MQFFNKVEGYSFITSDSGAEDIIVHAPDVSGNPLSEGHTWTPGSKKLQHLTSTAAHL